MDRPVADLAATEAIKISVRDLNFYYGGFHALKNIQLDIPERKVTAFIGPSGCGKSTLLRVFNRMYELYPEQRAQGQVWLDGEDLLRPGLDVALIRAKIGMVFQRPTPFPMSIYDNIAFGVRLFEALPRVEMDERVEWALRKAALWDEVKDKLQQSGLSLSGNLYCYRNPLEHTGNPQDKIRNPFYDTCCCPPNLQRILASLPGYFYSTSKDGLYVHLFDNNTLNWKLEDGTPIRVSQTTRYPWQGRIEITVNPPDAKDFTLFVRRPSSSTCPS